MNVLKKAILSAVMSLAVIGPIASVPTVQAHPDTGHQHQRIYWVYYRASVHHHWTNYGGYYHHDQAHRAQAYFRSHGYESFIR